MRMERVLPGDAEALLEIYAPYVEETAISFEYTVPTVSEFRRRIAEISAKFPYIKAVDGVSFELKKGRTLGIVGESGSGKSTLGQAILRLVDSEGEIRFGNKQLNILSQNLLRPLRRQMQVVFQDPFGSLSPRMSVQQIISEGLLAHDIGTEQEREDTQKGLDAAKGYVRREVTSAVDLRVSPEIFFSFDESVGEGDKIDRLLREVRSKEGW